MFPFYGDVNSTVAAALVCSKLMIRVGHVEAGLSLIDRTMPEGINRLLRTNRLISCSRLPLTETATFSVKVFRRREISGVGNDHDRLAGAITASRTV